MKPLLLILTFTFLSALGVKAQTARDISGTVIDSTKLSVPGSSIKLVSNTGDSTISITNADGKFTFSAVKGSKITLTISSIGYTSLIKHFALDDNNKPVDLGSIVLKAETNMLNQVNIVGAPNPITLKEDTVVYNASSYKVRANAPAEDLLKKLPGVDVDVNGNVSTQGKQVTKVRINGKDYMGGDVQSATKNLPADIIENIQMIDDYGDQANLTGVKSGEPDKILNITIRKDKNYGYTAQGTVGDGRDALPQDQGVPNKNRYLGSLNIFNFKGDQQIAVQGSINNTNVNTFSFGSSGGGGGNFGGGGGRGNAGRGGGATGSLITTQNGITDAKSIGLNFRDQWGKNLAVYGSYSFADNTTNTSNNIFQQNTSSANPSEQHQLSLEQDEKINHRFNWNMEYKPDTVNYFKFTPSFSYAGTNTIESDSVSLTRKGTVSSAYTSNTNGDSQSPTYGITGLYNHKFKQRRNLSILVNANSAPSWSYQNPIYNFAPNTEHTAPENQSIATYSRTNSYGANVSYLQPLGKRSYFEFNYALNYSTTNNNKETDTLFNPIEFSFMRDSLLSNRYNYTFTTNRFGLNYRFIEKKYNYTLGLAVQPSTLDGFSENTGASTHKNTFNFIPTARFIYNFSRSQTFSVNYNGSNAAPTFTQIQPVVDQSNAYYPVQGNPYLNPAFTNNVSIRYNNFSFATGNVFFANFNFQKIQNQVVTNSISSNTSNRILTQYLNADGFYNVTGRLTYVKPWAERKFSLTLNGTATYNNNIGYLSVVNEDPLLASQQEIDAAREKNIAKNLVFTPEFRFRVDIPNVVDVQFLTNYSINKTSNSINNQLTQALSNVRTLNIGLNGKNYFGDWVFSYDYTKANNYGYASNIQITNPNILNVYVERRFLKNKVATIRASAFDLFNQNTGFTSSTTASSITQSSVNRLARYFLLTFSLRLQKFAGKAPTQNEERGPRNGGGPGGDGGGRPGGGGQGGPPGGGF
ncbi:CarboxypepD_reg-like domain-containing protein [Mucilaginibacter pineti]|uniref:CarboxypepD_reg-like domain-containing protein n=1 Tax=Mucilaginibacter pineti TaxID=1391627 RepID=A0A1G7FE62_9SPHI|nr:outer membrane beta-barrel protein [Mucilaginibacter pineti]SDE74172.1 CarboxypepD_reg-like domain-containing protein [Mucilaginibacter pineti]